MTKQLQIYQYIQAGHSQVEASKHFKCSPSYVSRAFKIESKRHGFAWKDNRFYKKPEVL